jgi:hypothetical protein
MKKIHPLTTLATACALAFVAASASAQPGTPVAAFPPVAPSSSADRAGPGPIESTNSPGQPGSHGSVRELRFAAVDADSDGLISLSEFITFMDAGNGPRKTDGNSGVNPTELLFRQIDRNSDNFLSEREVTGYQDEQDREATKR